MRALLRKWFGNQTARPKPHTPPLRLEALEERIVPTFTNNGGPVLANVAIQGLYLGSDWSNTSPGNPNPAPASHFDHFLKYLVNSPFMDMLKEAGYGVGRGTFTPGIIDPVTLTQGSKTTYLTDSAIQADIQQEITNGKLGEPVANNLYVVFVEDNVPVQAPGGATSNSSISGYHNFFKGTDAGGNAATINYAVITVPGGTVHNISQPSGVAKSVEMTVAASRQIANAVTDPETNSSPAWYDDSILAEVGDVAAGQFVYLKSYAVQRISDVNDQPMTPKAAAPSQPVAFLLENGNNLYEHTSSGNTLIAGNVASISNQSINNLGGAMLDYVDTSGNAWEFNDGSAPTQIWTGGVKQAVASQGVDYVLLTTGKLYEKYVTASQWTLVVSNVASISAGTDKYGVSCVDYVNTSGAAYEYSLSTGKHLIKSSGVASVSAGPLGTAGVVLTTGEGDFWQEKGNKTTVLAASGVKQITVGSMLNGGMSKGDTLVERLDTNGELWEYQTGIGGTPIALRKNGVVSISNPRLGIVDAILSDGTAQEHNDATTQWTLIDSNTVIGVG